MKTINKYIQEKYIIDTNYKETVPIQEIVKNWRDGAVMNSSKELYKWYEKTSSCWELDSDNISDENVHYDDDMFVSSVGKDEIDYVQLDVLYRTWPGSKYYRTKNYPVIRSEYIKNNYSYDSFVSFYYPFSPQGPETQDSTLYKIAYTPDNLANLLLDFTYLRYEDYIYIYWESETIPMPKTDKDLKLLCQEALNEPGKRIGHLYPEIDDYSNGLHPVKLYGRSEKTFWQIFTILAYIVKNGDVSFFYLSKNVRNAPIILYDNCNKYIYFIKR